MPSHEDIAPASRTCESQSGIVTNGRTDERTERSAETAQLLNSANVRARTEIQRASGFNLGQIIDQVVTDLEVNAGQRWPLLRTGEREPIPWPLRLSIYKRDGGVCRLCGRGDSLELDHCLPWSAGGPDDSDNLRVLCQPCNTRRSNFVDYAHDTHHRPTTWWCVDCWTDDEPRYRTVWNDGTDLTRAPFVTDPTEQAFCAWCDYYSFTDAELLLVGEHGRRLLRLIAQEAA